MEYKSGIYKIINTKNNKIYIGSAVDLNKRWSNHLNELRKNKHHNIHLQRSFNKNGENCLNFVIIEKCDANVLIDREQYYIDTLNPKYNICKIAGNCTGRVVSEETRKKISDKLMGVPLSPERIAKFKGRVRSEESKKKQSLTTKGKPLHPNAKIKMLEKCSKAIILMENNIEIMGFNSMSDCARYLKVSQSSVRRTLNKIRGPLRGIYTFKLK